MRRHFKWSCCNAALFITFSRSFLYFLTFGEKTGPSRRRRGSDPRSRSVSGPRSGVRDQHLSCHPGRVAASQLGRHLQSEVQKGSILGCCVWAEWAGLITPHYSRARCPSRPAGVTRCGVVAFLPEETKMQCTIGGVIWPRARFMPRSPREGVNPSVAVPTPRSGL